MNWLQKISGEMSEIARNRLDMAGATVVESEESNNYEIYLVHIPQIDIYQIGFQRKGKDFTNIQQQQQKTPLNENAISGLSDIDFLRDIINKWTQQYGTIYAVSHNSSKYTTYKNILNWIGFSPKEDIIMGQPVLAIG